MCKLSRAFPGKWDPAPPGLVKQAIKYKACGPAGRYNCSLDHQTRSKSGFTCNPTHPAYTIFFQPVIPTGMAWGGSAPVLARNAGHSHTSLNQQLPTCHSYFVTC